jgi:PilZ domain-containing protein
MNEPDLDRPGASAHADVTVITRGITVPALVEIAGETTLTVRPTDEGLGAVEVRSGDAVDLYWVGDHEERTLPATVSAVEGSAEPRWRLSVTGPATRSQRRKAVRALVQLPVLMPWAGSVMTGKTVDVSEAGMRALMDGWGLPPEPGTPVQADVTLDDDHTVDLYGVIVRQLTQGAQWQLSMRFDDVPEDVADRLRRRVFQGLRDERARFDS